MKLILLLLMLPSISFTQFVTSVESELSPAAQLLIEQAKQNPKKSDKPKSLGFNLAITSRFDGGIMTAAGELPFDFDLFNVTSLEFYIPSSRNTRFLATVRFSTPVLEHDYSNELRTGLYQQRLGWGIGLSSTFMDSRNSRGVGIMMAFNILFAHDYLFLDYSNNSLIDENITMYRLDLGMRLNNFIGKNLAFVVGLDFGVGLNRGIQYIQTGSDGYPVEPLRAYGEYYRAVVTFGATVGIMF